MNRLEAKRSDSYIDLYLDGSWIADIHVEPDSRIAFFTGELDTIARKGGTASAMLLIGGPNLVEVRHDEERKSRLYLEKVLDEATSQE